DVVAVVNGDEITKDEFVDAYTGQFQQMSMQAQQTGQMPDQKTLKKQVAERMVGTRLLLQEADKQGVKAPQKRVDRKLDELAKQSGIESKEELLKTLKEQQGLDKSQIMDDVKTEVNLEALVEK